jgi:hypothetical protein
MTMNWALPGCCDALAANMHALMLEAVQLVAS